MIRRRNIYIIWMLVGLLLAGWIPDQVAAAEEAPAIEWEMAYSAGAQAGEIQQTQDDGYIMVGNSIQTPKMILTKTDKQGQEQWSRVIRPEKSRGLTGVSVQQTKDGEYIVGGVNLITSGVSHYYVAKTDSNGQIVWEADLLPDYSRVAALNMVRETSDGDD